MNLYEQLKAEYEASTDCEWELFPRQGYSPREEEAFLGYEIDGPPQPVRGQFVRRADAIFCISAHEKGYPLFMAVFEAAARIYELQVERNNTQARIDAMYDEGDAPTRAYAHKLEVADDAILDSCHALCAALAPLLVEEE